MSDLKLRTTEMFGEIQTDIYENEYHEMFMTARQLGECLGYKSKSGIDMLINRNTYLKDEEFSCTHHLLVPQGNGYSMQETRVFNEDGIYEVTFLANTDKAKEFRCWVRRLLKSLRKGDLQLTNGNAIFSPDLFEAAIAKHYGMLNHRLLSLETKKLTKPNFWLWKKHIAGKAIDTLCDTLHIDGRTAYDMVYDNMTSMYGFDKSFAISQFSAKYNIDTTETVAVIDAIADVPEYQREFIDIINHFTDCKNKNNTYLEISSPINCDRVQQIIKPLIQKYGDNSPNGSKTYKKVYDKMGKSNKAWKSMRTRYGCNTNKEILLKNDRYYKDFSEAVNSLLSETR